MINVQLNLLKQKLSRQLRHFFPNNNLNSLITIGFGVSRLQVKLLTVPSFGLKKRGLTSEGTKVVQETPERDDTSEGYETMTQSASDSMSQVIFQTFIESIEMGY